MQLVCDVAGVGFELMSGSCQITRALQPLGQGLEHEGPSMGICSVEYLLFPLHPHCILSSGPGSAVSPASAHLAVPSGVRKGPILLLPMPEKEGHICRDSGRGSQQGEGAASKPQ